MPQAVVAWFDRFLRFFGFPDLLPTIDGVAHLLALVIVFGIAAYVVSCPVYEVVRRIAMSLDMRDYKKMTGGKDPTVHWEVVSKAGEGTEATEAPS